MAAQRDSQGRWKKGAPSPNPAGRPPMESSWAEIIKQVSDQYPEDLLAIIDGSTELGKQIAALPRNVQVKYLVVARVLVQLMTEPTAGLWNGLMDRAEGKVKEQFQVDGQLNVSGLEEMIRRIYGKRDDQS